MSEDYRIFWSKPSHWPIEKPGYIFLARAMREAGALRFGEVWTERDAWSPAPDKTLLLPEDQTKANASQIRHAYRLSDFPVPSSHALDDSLASELLHEFAWVEARARQMDRFTAEANAWKRFIDLCGETHRMFLDGRLKLFVRGLEGGDLTGPLDPSLWNTEKAKVRFSYCQIDLANPYNQSPPDARENIRRPSSKARPQLMWMFIDEESYRNWIDSLPRPQNAAAVRSDEGSRKGGARTREDMSIENLCIDWLVGLMESDPGKLGHEATPAPTKSDLSVEAKNKWPTFLTGRAFHRAFSAAIAKGGGRFAAWTNPYL